MFESLTSCFASRCVSLNMTNKRGQTRSRRNATQRKGGARTRRSPKVRRRTDSPRGELREKKYAPAEFRTKYFRNESSHRFSQRGQQDDVLRGAHEPRVLAIAP